MTKLTFYCDKNLQRCEICYFMTKGCWAFESIPLCSRCVLTQNKEPSKLKLTLTTKISKFRKCSKCLSQHKRLTQCMLNKHEQVCADQKEELEQETGVQELAGNLQLTEDNHGDGNHGDYVA